MGVLIGFSIIFTIHFGGFSPYFWVNTHIIFNAPPRLSAFAEQMKLAESHFASVAAASPGELESGSRNGGNGGNGTAGMEKPVPKKKPIKTTLAMPSTEMEEKSEMEKSEVSQAGIFGVNLYI